MERQSHDHVPVELSAQLVSIMTTEHNNVQTGRSIAIAEVNGRASLFVGAVSSTLIALTLVAQLSHLGTAFFVFSLVVLPTLIFMGLSTFERALQVSAADFLSRRRINRIRHLYVEYAPQLQPYFIRPADDDTRETMTQEGFHPSWVQAFFSMASMIAVITSVLLGSFAGLLLVLFRVPLGGCVSAGAVVFLASFGGHLRYGWPRWMQLERTVPVDVPSQPGP